MTTSAPLSLFLFILNTTPSAYSQVQDVKGAPLKPNVPYFILPSTCGSIGLAARAPNRTCPLDVVLQTVKTSTKNGFPVTFSPVNSSDNVIKTSIDLNLEFSASTICVTSTVWRIEDSSSSNKYFVTIGGVKGNPGQATLSNWFRIESYKKANYYVLVSCPAVCETCRPVCGNIGVIVDNGRRRLGITFDDQPLKVTFVAADRQHS